MRFTPAHPIRATRTRTCPLPNNGPLCSAKPVNSAAAGLRTRAKRSDTVSAFPPTTGHTSRDPRAPQQGANGPGGKQLPSFRIRGLTGQHPLKKAPSPISFLWGDSSLFHLRGGSGDSAVSFSSVSTSRFTEGDPSYTVLWYLIHIPSESG